MKQHNNYDSRHPFITLVLSILSLGILVWFAFLWNITIGF